MLSSFAFDSLAALTSSFTDSCTDLGCKQSLSQHYCSRASMEQGAFWEDAANSYVPIQKLEE